MSKKSNIETAYEAARDAFDEACSVKRLSPSEYLEVIEKMEAQLQCYKNCLRDENPELFE